MENNYENLSDEQLADRVIHEFKADGVDEYVDSHAEDRKGLGDTIEKTFSKFGITSKVIEKIMGTKGCGCNERKNWLNKIFPYNKKKKKDD